MLTAVSGNVILPIGEIICPGSNLDHTELLELLTEWGFNFLGIPDHLGIIGATLPAGWKVQGEPWIPGNLPWSTQWWILDDKDRKRVEVTMKIPWGSHDWTHYLVIQRAYPGAKDPRIGW